MGFGWDQAVVALNLLVLIFSQNAYDCQTSFSSDNVKIEWSNLADYNRFNLTYKPSSPSLSNYYIAFGFSTDKKMVAIFLNNKITFILKFLKFEGQ